MVRALRYPRISVAACALTLLAAVARDICTGSGLNGWANVLLVATLSLMTVCLVLLSCRFFVDERGVGVGFLLDVRHAEWQELAALGVLCCNSRRPYLYGLYRESPSFLKMLHRAPRCGSWGFVVPLSRKLASEIALHCPYEVDFSPVPHPKRAKRLRAQWHQAVLYALLMLPGIAVAVGTCALMLLYAQQQETMLLALAPTLGAIGLACAGMFLIYRMLMLFITCPGINETGVCAGPLLYLPWEEVRFGYVHRVARMSGLFLLSRQLGDTVRRGAPPVVCFSMPDTSTLLLAYLTYCPNAPREVQTGRRF